MNTHTVALPPYLVKRIGEGRVILFLGAGASIGCRNTLAQNPPLGGGLAKILSDTCGITVEEYDDLSTIAANAKRILGDLEYWNLLRKHYMHCRPSDAYKCITRYYWTRIYTTNIDDGLEAAFGYHREQKYEVLVHSSPIDLGAVDRGIVQYIKLNGSIDRLEQGLVFTPDEYGSMQAKQRTWYDEVAKDFLDHTFVFIGSQLNEPIFKWQVQRLQKAAGVSSGRSYIICPQFSEHRQRDLQANNIEPIHGTIDDFARALVDALGPRLPPSEVSIAKNPSLYELINSEVLRDSLTKHMAEIDTLTVVNADNLKRFYLPDSSAVRRFYYGTEPTWRDVLDGVPARLSFQDDLISSLADSSHAAIIVQGPAGSGKTTLLMMAALEVSQLYPHHLVLWVNRGGPFPEQAIDKICQHFGERVIVFIDDVSRHVDSIARLVRGATTERPIFVLSDRANMIARTQVDNKISGARKIRISRIKEVDVDPILGKLERFGPWDRLGKMTASDRRRALIEVAEKQLLVGLREVTSGVGFDGIIRSEYDSIGSGYPQSVVLLVAMASMHRHYMSKKTLVGALQYFSGESPPSNLDEGVEEIVLVEGSYVRFRHPIIAEYIVTRVLDRRRVLDGIRSILVSLSRFGVPINRTARGPEARLFAALINHDELWTLFRGHRSLVLALFREMEQCYRGESLFWLHYALFEQKCGTECLEDARNHIRTAIDIYPESYQILNAFANIHYDAAVSASDAATGLALMEDATSVMERQCADPKTEPYAIVGLCLGRARVLKKWFPEKLRQERKELQARLKDAKFKYPGNKDIEGALRALALDVIPASTKASATKTSATKVAVATTLAKNRAKGRNKRP